MEEREKLEILGEHLDNLQTAIRASHTEFKSIERKQLPWAKSEDALELLEKLDDVVQERLDELDDELEELDNEK